MTSNDIDWWPPARVVESPNQDARPPGQDPELIVVHAISLPPGEFGGPHIAELFQNRLDPQAHPYFAEIAALHVSAHVLINRDGWATQFVPFSRRAWHAGASQWCGRERCNDFSIGIELEGTDEDPFTPAQYAELARLVGWLRARYPGIGADGLVGHSDIAPGRKTDPGPCFDWTRLRRQLQAVTA
ncbi:MULTISPECIES: 1,6-anhydro-N-acetylmuramyl-L-alanine amidase AmpD [unclassified Thioalkalivibrio]|uniref:1,6-anhydro-N-acetylmuramyl-L-alanine amidase AmpD n=1 Tax=unclassified Thioalkalivibrio TaxID=2621013 RepID=UPI000374EA77|nr:MULTISPECIES: 1,6-anhydro-N-acetylmuramyl-L-alanine amidase AmpD [unclassified Thioalkalivibrio]